MTQAIKALFVLLLLLLVAALTWVCQYFISPIDVVTGRDRVVAKRELPNGDTIEVFQYWNHGDFYNLDLTHTTAAGVQYLFVINPDCNRIPRCEVETHSESSEAVIKAGGNILAHYRWDTKELLRKNGVLIQGEPLK